jgi:hypothetical protein
MIIPAFYYYVIRIPAFIGIFFMDCRFDNLILRPEFYSKWLAMQELVWFDMMFLSPSIALIPEHVAHKLFGWVTFFMDSLCHSRCIPIAITTFK